MTINAVGVALEAVPCLTSNVFVVEVISGSSSAFAVEHSSKFTVQQLKASLFSNSMITVH